MAPVGMPLPNSAQSGSGLPIGVPVTAYLPSFPMSSSLHGSQASSRHQRNSDDDVLVDVLQRQAMKDQSATDMEYDPTSYSYANQKDSDDNRPRNYGRSRNNRDKYRREDTSNTTLVVTGIPHNLNTVGKIDEHFSKFGSIVNIEVLVSQKKANVKFTSHSEALKAFKSTEVKQNVLLILIACRLY